MSSQQTCVRLRSRQKGWSFSVLIGGHLSPWGGFWLLCPCILKQTGSMWSQTPLSFSLKHTHTNACKLMHNVSISSILSLSLLELSSISFLCKNHQLKSRKQRKIKMKSQNESKSEWKSKRSCVSAMKDLFLSMLYNSVYTLGIQLRLMGSFVLGELGKCTKLHWLEPQSTELLISDPFWTKV